jgi:hypothetical protein
MSLGDQKDAKHDQACRGDASSGFVLAQGNGLVVDAGDGEEGGSRCGPVVERRRLGMGEIMKSSDRHYQRGPYSTERAPRAQLGTPLSYLGGEMRRGQPRFRKAGCPVVRRPETARVSQRPL